MDSTVCWLKPRIPPDHWGSSSDSSGGPRASCPSFLISEGGNGIQDVTRIRRIHAPSRSRTVPGPQKALRKCGFHFSYHYRGISGIPCQGLSSEVTLQPPEPQKSCLQTLTGNPALEMEGFHHPSMNLPFLDPQLLISAAALAVSRFHVGALLSDPLLHRRQNTQPRSLVTTFNTFLFYIGGQPTKNALTVSGGQQRDLARHMHVFFHTQTPHRLRLPPNTGQSSLRCTVGPCWLPILNIAVCKRPSHTP